ncbi:BglG family transcription antiterminator [Aquibacillus sp. 3ASR75-11]|uniref:BglG family transcription antiterminator n=1 Tax=Terrihalobacillus insolitus TaxID=2950438 RepID=A0A9X4AMC0_9BACI|nr:BglG family transcription antiterminator [Terrihalobacillus insolitus]MDC3411961.1 BglG family transcription antiterminator [Terrihalobacillus insolitus]MDC3423353.1 BglG family transcription antiterminator [Terrihalobacillus insolitus]
MNDRQKVLLRLLLLKNKKTINIQDLSNQLGCSEKTVRNDLNQVEGLLVDYPSARLKRKPGVGILFDIDEIDRSALSDWLYSNEPKTSADRFVEIAYQLLVSDKPITLKMLAERYYVPKGAIKKDMETIGEWLKGYYLDLESKPRLGNVVIGTELNKRSALAHLSELTSSITQDKNDVLDLFLPYEITTVQKVLIELQHRYSIAFTDGAVESLLVHALIMMKRTRQKSSIQIPETEKETINRYKEYEYASYFFEQLESIFRITFPEDERIYFTWHLISSKKMEDSDQETFLKDAFLQEVVTEIIARLEKLTLVTFEEDTVLLRGLTVHVHSVINRIKYGFPITNPLLTDIKKMYPYMFNMVMLAVSEINEMYKLEIPEDEAAYLVLHFQASIERLEDNRRKQKKTLIVCHMGVGTSHLLEAKIKQHYQDIQVVACIGKAEVHDVLKKNPVDFIITTVPLEKIQIPHVVISPLLEVKDKEKLHYFMEELEYKNEENQKKKDLVPLIRGDLVNFDVAFEHPFEVVEMLGNILFNKGFINETFTSNALARERESSTSIGGGIAIPHGSPTMVHQSAIAVAVLKEPMEWGSEFVSIVFMLAISNQQQALNRGAVAQIATISSDLSLVQALIDADSVETFLNKLR